MYFGFFCYKIGYFNVLKENFLFIFYIYFINIEIYNVKIGI